MTMIKKIMKKCQNANISKGLSRCAGPQSVGETLDESLTKDN